MYLKWKEDIILKFKPLASFSETIFFSMNCHVDLKCKQKKNKKTWYYIENNVVIMKHKQGPY